MDFFLRDKISEGLPLPSHIAPFGEVGDGASLLSSSPAVNSPGYDEGKPRPFRVYPGPRTSHDARPYPNSGESRMLMQAPPPVNRLYRNFGNSCVVLNIVCINR